MGACARRIASVASLTDTFGYRRAPRRPRCLAHALPARTPNPHQASRLTGDLRVVPLRGVPELEEGDDLGALLADAATRAGGLEDDDVLVVAQKAVSKVEGRVVHLDEIEPSERARELAGDTDPRRLEVILREAREVLRARPPLVIAETRHGFVCASAGVDASNAKGPDTLVLLPVDPDASAAALRDAIHERLGVVIGVIVSDSFGRAWRRGTTDVALGVSGVAAVVDLAGRRDAAGYELHATEIAVADEIAGAAQLVMGKTDGIPAAIVRGVRLRGDGRGSDLLMPRERDLFR
jgi:coenzyme F420-0:L-glutamate ligase/coenzyme F420-1:gamma-L-glutamate ligase